MWLRPRFETTHEEDLKRSQHIYGNPVSFCVVPPKLSEEKCRNSNKLNRYPCFNRGKKGMNYWPIKADETCGHKNGNPANP